MGNVCARAFGKEELNLKNDIRGSAASILPSLLAAHVLDILF